MGMRLTPVSPLHLCNQAATFDEGDTQGQSVLVFLVFLPCRAILPAYGAGPYLPAIVMERPVYVREISDGLYTAFTYLLYKVQLTWNVWKHGGKDRAWSRVMTGGRACMQAGTDGLRIMT